MGSSNIRDILTSFSPSMDFFAITAGDGRIKIWDTLKGQVQTEFADIMSTDATSLYPKPERGHLSVDYTCMKWMSLDKKRKRKPLCSLLLLGTGSGDVLALDVSSGELKWRISDCHPGGVSAISFSTHCSCIYATGADGMICKIDPMSGNLLGKFKASTKAISSMSVSPDGKLLATAAAQLKIFNCLDQKKIQKFSGHPGAVRCIIFTEDGKYIFSSSVDERYVAVWRINGTKKQSASCVLAMDHPAVFLDSWCVNKGGIETELYVLAISEIGVCYLWHGPDIEGLRNTKPTKVSFSLQDDVSKNHRGARPTIYAAKLQGIAKPGSCHVFIAHGLLVKPSFQKLSVQAGTDIKLNSSQNGVLLPFQPFMPKQGQDSQIRVTALDRANVEDALLPIPKLFEAHDNKKRLQSLGLDVGKVASDGLIRGKSLVKSLKSTDGLYKDQVEAVRFCMEDQAVKVCMEDRLKSLGIINNKDNHTSGLTLNSTLLKGIHLETNVPQKKMREAVLSMVPSDAFELLKVLVSMWQSRPCSGKYVLPWIYSILVNRSNYVTSQGSASEVIDFLYKSTEYKTMAMQSLLQLSGRLHLVTAQIDKVAQNKSPTNHHIDEDEDEDENEDVVDDFFYGLEDDKSENNSDESD